MKALKEKRNSFRSLWRMGLVILSVFALVLAACGNIETGSVLDSSKTVDPPKEISKANGDTTTPASEYPSSIQIKRGSRPTAYSKEGQPPNLAGLEFNVLYKDGSMKPGNLDDFETVPAILGMAELNSSAPTTGVVTPIIFRHKRFTEVYTTIELPGVVPLMRSQSSPPALGTWDGVAYDSVTSSGSLPYPLQAQVIGAMYNNGARVFGLDEGTTGVLVYENSDQGVEIVSGYLYEGMDIFQDGEEPDITPLKVKLNYQAMIAGGTLGAAAASSDTVNFTKDYIFHDYNTIFRTWDTTTQLEKDGGPEQIYYPFGLDDGVYQMYILISRGTTHGGPGNNSIYIAIPFGPDCVYHYVRYVNVHSMNWAGVTKWGDGRAYDFITQADAINMGGRDKWNDYLVDREIELEVYYWDYTGSKIRGPDYFYRSYTNRRGGITNNPRFTGDADEEGFGELMIGYYSSAPNQYDRDPIGVGDFANVPVPYQVPVGVFVEGSLELQKKAKAGEGPDNDLRIFVNTNMGDPVRVDQASPMTDQQLLVIKNTYDAVGRLRSVTTGQETGLGIIIPGDDFTMNFFAGQRPFARIQEIETVEISFRVPTRTRLLADFGDAGQPTAKFNEYSQYIGEEAEFSVLAFPYDYEVY